MLVLTFVTVEDVSPNLLCPNFINFETEVLIGKWPHWQLSLGLGTCFVTGRHRELLLMSLDRTTLFLIWKEIWTPWVHKFSFTICYDWLKRADLVTLEGKCIVTQMIYWACERNHIPDCSQFLDFGKSRQDLPSSTSVLVPEEVVKLAGA